MISTRTAQGNNPYMAAFAAARHTSSIIYNDTNNIFVLTMSQTLPLSGFAWMSAGEAQPMKGLALTEEQEEAYFKKMGLN